jgi:hypothetical protein
MFGAPTATVTLQVEIRDGRFRYLGLGIAACGAHALLGCIVAGFVGRSAGAFSHPKVERPVSGQVSDRPNGGHQKRLFSR